LVEPYSTTGWLTFAGDSPGGLVCELMTPTIVAVATAPPTKRLATMPTMLPTV
jgi:hypothetical protein